MSTYGSHPGKMTVKLTLGDGAHLVATSANGWAGPVSLRWGPTDGEWTEATSTLTDVGTVDGTEVSWTLTVEQVTARAAFPYVRLVDNGMTMQAGEVIPWTGGLGSTVTQTIASLTAGPPGPTAVSADADNVATLGSDGLIYVPESVGGGGDTTVQIGTVTLPESPTSNVTVSVLADSTTVLPEGVTWDSGGEPTITERMLLVFVWSGEDWVGTYGPSIPNVPVAPDTTGPTAGTLGVVVDVTTADGTVTGAADETELDATPYSFRIDAGTYSAWQAGATYEWTGLDPATEYDFQHRVRDAAGNVTEGTVVTDTTDADTTGPTAGTLGVVPGVTTADLTVTGASDDIALHATPYAFSTDNGSTWTAYQAGATYEATGLTADTSYTFRHKVRDAAGNETVGTAVTDSTDPEPSDTTPPTPGTLAASAITSSGFTLTVTGASDDEALHAQPYRFSTDNGVTYSAWQAGATFNATGLDPETEYTCVHQVRDAALNVATGSAIQVTTEAEVSDPLAGFDWEWRFESDSITGLSNGDPVSTWPDTSGNSRHATQATSGNRPTWSASAFGGAGGVSFSSGTEQRLVTSSITALTQPTTIFVVGSTANTASRGLFDGLSVSNRHNVFRGSSQSQAFAGAAVSSLSPVNVTEPSVFAFRFNTTSSSFWQRGSFRVSTGNVGTQTLTGLTVGNRFESPEAAGGTIGAILVINESLSNADMNTVGAYLATKYGLEWTPLA